MATTEQATHLQSVAKSLAGRNYNDFRDRLESEDWYGWYPVVDINGNLTGETVEANDTTGVVVDVTSSGVTSRMMACDAVLLVDPLLPDLADALGYDRIEWDAENDCYSGYGSAEPYDRSKDTPAGYYVCAAEEIVKTLRRHL